MFRRKCTICLCTRVGDLKTLDSDGFLLYYIYIRIRNFIKSQIVVKIVVPIVESPSFIISCGGAFFGHCIQEV